MPLNKNQITRKIGRKLILEEKFVQFAIFHKTIIIIVGDLIIYDKKLFVKCVSINTKQTGDYAIVQLTYALSGYRGSGVAPYNSCEMNVRGFESKHACVGTCPAEMGQA